MKTQKTEIVYSSGPAEYEFLTVEILVDGEPIVRIDRELGIEKLRAIIIKNNDSEDLIFSFDELISLLNDAKKAMLERFS